LPAFVILVIIFYQYLSVVNKVLRACKKFEDSNLTISAIFLTTNPNHSRNIKEYPHLLVRAFEVTTRLGAQLPQVDHLQSFG